MNAKITLLGIEAELPVTKQLGLMEVPLPGDHDPLPVLKFGSEVGLCLIRCIDASAIEVFAATAAMKWREIYMAMERLGTVGPMVEMSRKDEYWHARDQFRFWSEIRDKAVKEQRP